MILGRGEEAESVIPGASAETGPGNKGVSLFLRLQTHGGYGQGMTAPQRAYTQYNTYRRGACTGGSEEQSSFPSAP